MATNLKNAKKGTGSVLPERAIDASGGIDRVEPVLTGKIFRKRFFFGIPLVSPITREKLSDSDLDDYIKRSMNQVELDTKLDIQPVIRRFRLPFDPNLYHQHIHCEIPNKPIQKVIRMAICSASYIYTGEPNESSKYPSGAEIYKIPNEWVEMGNALRGILNVNPISPAFSAVGTSTAVAASGATVLQFIGQQGWVPAYWTVECVNGFCSEDGNIPIILNEIIGQKAAIMLIDNLLPLFRIAGQSLGIDGLSQSVNDLSYQLLQTKRQAYDSEYQSNVKKLKTLTGNNILISNV